MKSKLVAVLVGAAVIGYPVTTALLFGSLRKTQHELRTSAQESTATRVHTVAQRCDLTKLILRVLVAQDPKVAGAFHRSYRKCEAQLVEVKAINARAHGRAATTTPH